MDEKRMGISGSTLKLIAIIAMLIDHIGAIVLERMLRLGNTGLERMEIGIDLSGLYVIYLVMRLIGRLGFPIFCFLLIEGMQYTKDIKKYALRLFLFAVISEVPFDLGFAGRGIYWQYQNVFFTLFIGLLVMIGFRKLEDSKKWGTISGYLLYLLVLGVGMGAAELLQTDYSAMGVLTIAAMYQYRRKRVLSVGIGCAILTVMSILEVTAFATLLPICLYNGKRGWNIKWLFYAFYPVHILVLYLIACGLGLGDIMLR